MPPASSSGSCPLRILTVVGLLLSGAALVVMSTWTPATSLGMVAIAMATFGLGFGLTVTARSTAAVERAGEAAFGVASATVTVARMIGMSVGLAVLTAYGSTTIDRLHDQIYNTPGGYLQYIPVALQGRDLHDPLVVGALETWASGEAARIMVGLFLVGGGARPGLDPARSRPGDEPYWQKTGCGVGCAAAGSAGPELSGLAISWTFWTVPTRTLRGLEPERLIGRREGRVEVGDVAMDGHRLVQELHVVAGVDLDDHPDHRLAVVDLRRGQDRQEHPRPGMGVEVGGSGLAGLVELGDVHRDVARWERIGRARLLDHRQVDPQCRHDDPGRDPTGGRGRRRGRQRLDRLERRQAARTGRRDGSDRS